MKRPLPLDTRAFPDLVAGLKLREVGALVLVACAYWRAGEPLDEAAIAKVLDVRGTRLVALLPVLDHFFRPGAAFPILREAHLMKSGRRAKIARRSNLRRWAAIKSREKTERENVEPRP